MAIGPQQTRGPVTVDFDWLHLAGEKPIDPITSGGTYQILSRADGGAVTAPSKGRQLSVTPREEEAVDSQKFVFTANPDGSYRVKSVSGGKCLQVGNKSTAKAVLSHCGTGETQTFRVVRAPEGGYALTTSGDLVVTVSETRGLLVQEPDKGIPAQRWSFVPA